MLGLMEIPLNHFFNDRTGRETIAVLTNGPLSPYLPAYAQRLHDEGYAVQSGQLQLRLLGQFSRWLDSKKLGLPPLARLFWDSSSFTCERSADYPKRRLRNTPPS